MRVLDNNLLRLTAGGFELVGQQCANCGKIAFPRKRVCPQCFSATLAEKVLSSQGTLHTYTTTYLGPPSLPSPYSMGFLDLPEGIKLLGLIQVAQPAEAHLKIGMTMDIALDAIRKDPDGEPVYGYVFRPAAERRTR